MKGEGYRLIQTKIDDTDSFSFAAEGQAENPRTCSVAKGQGRSVASGKSCQTEISYWNKTAHAYVTDKININGNHCDKLISVSVNLS